MGLMFRFTVACAVLASSTNAFAIYKCKDQNGKTSFQETPCTSGANGGAYDVKPASGQSDPAAVANGQERLAKLKFDNAVEDATRKKLPMAGMTVDQLKRSMGSPTVVNRTVTEGGKQSNQHVYYRQDGTWYVYTDETGHVTSFQSTEYVAPSAKPQKACPSDHQIRTAETEASSIALPYAVRVEKMKHVEEMKRCK